MISDRDAIAILHEAGIGPGSAAGLVWRLREVDGFNDERIAREASIKLDCVRVYLSRVNRRLRASHEQFLAGQVEEPAPEDEDEEPEETLREAARHLLEAIANKDNPPDHAAEASRPPLVNQHDAAQVIRRQPVEFLPVVSEPGKNGARRKKSCPY